MFPQSFCLVKLNANTQKADGLISAQISGFVWDVVATSVRTKTQLHSTSTAIVLLLLLGLCSGAIGYYTDKRRGGGGKKAGGNLKIKCSGRKKVWLI